MANEYVGGTAAEATVGKMTNINTVRIRPVIATKIMQVAQRETAALAVMERATRVVTVDQPTWTSQHQGDIQKKTTVATAVADTTTTSVVVANDDHLIVGHVLLNVNTNEQMKVTTAAGSNTIVVTRGFNSTAANIGAGDVLIVVGTAIRESQNKPPVLMRGTDSKTYYAQHMAWAFGWSEWAAICGVYGPSEPSRITMQGIRNFKQNWERTLLLSQGGLDTTETQRCYTMRGLRELCGSENRCSLNGKFTYDGLQGAVMQVAQFTDSKSMLAFCGLSLIQKLSQIDELRSNFRVSPTIKSLGFDLTTLKFPTGISLTFVESNVLDEGDLAEEILVTTPGNIVRKRLQGLRVKHDIQDNGAYRTEQSMSVFEGLELENPYAATKVEDCGR